MYSAYKYKKDSKRVLHCHILNLDLELNNDFSYWLILGQWVIKSCLEEAGFFRQVLMDHCPQRICVSLAFISVYVCV